MMHTEKSTEKEINEVLPPFTIFTDLAAERLGGKVLSCSDDFFAEKENLIKPGRGVFIADKYTDRGKWMDGWESRRKRTPGHDWCIIQLAVPGKIRGVDIDTNHFLGNHPPFGSIEAIHLEGRAAIPEDGWTEILAKSPLLPGSHNWYAIEDERVYSHLKLHIYPDGGVARFKVYGEAFRNWDLVGDQEIDLAAAVNGAIPVMCNDMFFSHMENLIMPGRGINMGDGWETKRNRTPGNKDWVIIKLAHTGTVERLLIDTAHFKGNYPDACTVEGVLLQDDDERSLNDSSLNWQTILPQSRLQAHHEHLFSGELQQRGPFSHVRLTIFPDGGVSRMRVFGRIARS